MTAGECFFCVWFLWQVGSVVEVEEFSYFLFKVEGLAVGSPVFVGDCGAEGSFDEFYQKIAVF